MMAALLAVLLALLLCSERSGSGGSILFDMFDCLGTGLYLQNKAGGQEDWSSNHWPSGEQAWNVLYHMGGNSPWLPKAHGIVDTDIGPPAGCRVDQVHMVGLSASARQVYI